MRALLLICSAIVTWVVSLMHVTAQPPPLIVKPLVPEKNESSMFIPRSSAGIHQLVLHGTPYARGLAEGALTQPIMAKEEKTLFAEFERFFPNPILRSVLMVGLMRYFWGAERYFAPHIRQHFYGLAPFASPEFNHYIDPYTRQAVFHGIHEVGQMFVDFQQEDLGCTAIVLPNQESFIIGRNFDFEVGRLFDEEKTLKWHFPDIGNKFVSVSWPGFQGTITGVNEHGLYISLNAAGSKDYRRYGQTTTLLATDILQFATSFEDALARLEQAETFIADIFLLADAHQAARIEKTPRRTRIIPINGPHAITNHMIDPDLALDPVNRWRMEHLTTTFRSIRAEALIADINLNQYDREIEKELAVLSVLRDKRDEDGEPLSIGHRRAIDALIATHSVIYNARTGKLFVSTGPALAGNYLGYDLKASFASQTPIRSGELPEDPELTTEQFFSIKAAIKQVATAEAHLRENNCDAALEPLQLASRELGSNSTLHKVLGQYYACRNDFKRAKHHWRQALHSKPAYKQELEFLKEHL